MSSRVPRLLAISDRKLLRRLYGPGRRGLETWIGALRQAGIDGLQVREKSLDDRRQLEIAALAARLGGNLTILVNGRADVALAAGASGVHLPSDGVPVEALRQRFGGELILGRSTHRLEEVAAARDEGADYVTFGPVYPTPGKARYGPPVGLRELERAAAFGLPVLALGGVGPDQLAAAAAAGAYGAAGIRAFHEPGTLRRLRALRPRSWSGSPS